MSVCREDEGIGSETSPMPEGEDTPREVERGIVARQVWIGTRRQLADALSSGI